MFIFGNLPLLQCIMWGSPFQNSPRLTRLLNIGLYELSNLGLATLTVFLNAIAISSLCFSD